LTGAQRQRSLLPARVLCVLGLVFAAIGMFFVSIATGVLGMVLGMVGYFLGARTLGTVTVILSTVMLIVGILLAPAAIPGSYDEPVDGTPRPSSAGE
jgi:hypothetical protein